MHVEIMLLAPLVDRDTLKNQEVVVLGGDRAGFENRIFDPVHRHAAFDQTDPQMQPSGHLDRAAESDFAVALTEGTSNGNDVLRISFQLSQRLTQAKNKRLHTTRFFDSDRAVYAPQALRLNCIRRRFKTISI